MVCRITHSLTRKCCLLALIAALTGCSNRAEPRLEAWQDGSYQQLDVSNYEITGKRDGAKTRAVATITLESGDRVKLELVLTYDPTPALGWGQWSIDGPRAAAGEVRAESVKFVGGQGEGPSLGGRFLLEEDGRPRFRVSLPLQSVGQPKWTVE